MKTVIKECLDKCWEASQHGDWESAGGIGSGGCNGVPEVVQEVMDALNKGKVRVIDRVLTKTFKKAGELESDRDENLSEQENVREYLVNGYIKKAILLYFKFSRACLMSFGGGAAFDKIPLKFDKWSANDFEKAGFRVAPGAIIRYSAYIAPKTVVMQSFVNVGAFVDEESMLDTYSLVGSCAQVGKRCHISAGVILGGVLEPLQATPVIVEDECFIGAGSSVTEGVIVGKGAVIASGVHLTASTRIIDRFSGTETYGRVPAYSVVVPGTCSSKEGPNLGCAVIVKKRNPQEKTSINELLRL